MNEGSISNDFFVPLALLCCKNISLPDRQIAPPPYFLSGRIVGLTNPMAFVKNQNIVYIKPI